MDNLFLNFFLPAVDGSIHSALQIGFALSFGAALFLVPRAVTRNANSGQWEQRFAALDQKGAGPTGTTSANELADAVATPAERWADILPSLLLVFGLLGTFIGLGLALTEAAGALGPGADALANLTPIMDSLGSKFKTSTWGIFAFLGLKIWFTLKPYDEHRHDWAAGKLRAIAAQAAEEARQQHDGERLELIDAIARHRHSMQESQQLALQQASQRHAEQIAVLQQQTDRQRRLGEQQLEQAGLQLQALRELAAHLKEAATRDDLVLARLEAIAAHGAVTVDRLVAVADHVAASRIAMEAFSHSVHDNIQNMAKAAGDMADAAQAAGHASTQLGGAVGEFRDAMTNVLGEVKTELGSTISTMGITFAHNMERMSADLKAATEGIQGAIKTLSGGVTETVTQLQKASDDASLRQDKARAAFAASSDALTANMSRMGDFMDEMQKQVKLGLTSIATASARMASLDKQFEQRTEQDRATLDAVKGLAGSMEALVAQLGAAERALAPGVRMADDIRALTEAVKLQHAAQAVTDERQTKQSDENARMLASIGSLATAIAELSLVKQQDSRITTATSGQEAQ
ncbi:hypothetical protein [Massilia sp. DD77]|uniref:hypothetical protein n=1 Tax=Massilia sp. DD77 TaxID=3109349 RepID=UPI002FFE063C